MKLLQRLKSFFNPLTQVKNTVKRKKGLLHYYNRRKGYGFISSNQTSKDVFVHYSDMDDEIKRGDSVTFEVIFTKKGLRAENVELVKV